MGGESAQGLRLPARPPIRATPLSRLASTGCPGSPTRQPRPRCSRRPAPRLTRSLSLLHHHRPPLSSTLVSGLSPHLFRGSRRAPFGITGGHDPTSFQSVLQPHIHDHTRCTSFVNGYADFPWKPVVYVLTCRLQQHDKLLILWMFGCKRECRSKNLPRPSPSA